MELCQISAGGEAREVPQNIDNNRLIHSIWV